MTERAHDALCVVQARTGSSRLPGKVLQPIDGVPMLAFMLRRLLRQPPGELLVATTDFDRDDDVVAIARALGIPTVRGSEHDVLDRYRKAIERFDGSVVVRLTADCPLTDPQIVAAAIDLHCKAGADYTSNVFPRSYPKGLDVEVCGTEALLRAASEAKAPEEREHVTPYLYRHPELFRLANLDSGLAAGAERWTVDTPEDLERVRAIVSATGPDAPWENILETVGRLAVPTSDPSQLVLRRADDDDSDLFLRLRNDSDAVRWSTSRAAVAPPDHERWYRSVVHDPAHRLWVSEIDGVAVGTIRVDIEDAIGVVSVAVVPSARGKGFGRAMIEAVTNDVATDLQISSLRATVHGENEASLTAFRRAGFEPCAGGSADQVMLARAA